ncbi:MAG: AarF/ABC1/UbiB kinase family protein [Silicimonas sp.]|nr:AarF/ABC1/UbiB kinase family protein [Silicimonas sp.]
MSARPPRPVPASRAARLHRLGSLTTGIAARLARDSLHSLSRGTAPDLQSLLMTPRNITRITDDLSRMRGAAMKLGQLLSMETADVLPPELAAVLARLQAGADPMPPRQLKTVLTQAWGRDWLRHFRSFDVHPIAAASIGQVHRAQTKDGRDMAIKVQYPGIKRSIDSDVANLGSLIRLTGLLPKDFGLDPYLDAARAQLHLEADYRLEARALTRYRARLGDRAGFIMPEVITEFSTDTVLSMTYLAAEPIDSLINAPQTTRDRVMTDLLALFFEELFTHGEVQTDPNFANYRWCPTSRRVVLLDFGALRSFDPDLTARLRALLTDGLAGDQGAVEAHLRRLGVLGDTSPPAFRAAVLDMARMVFAELHTPFDFATNDLFTRLRDIGQQLARDRVPPPEPPVDLLYLQRKAGGMALMATRLGARVDLPGLLAPYRSDKTPQ